MQITAKATFLGFAQSLDPSTGLLEIAGVQISLAHTGGAAAGDVLQVDAIRGDDGAWSGIVTARFALAQHTRLAEIGAGAGATSAPAATKQPAQPQTQPAPAPQAASHPPEPIPAAKSGVRRFGISNARPAPAQSQSQSARPKFVASAADARVRY